MGYAWRAIFEIIHSVVLSDRSQNVLQRGCAASPRVRDILIPIASDVYLESMPGNCFKDCAAAPKIQCCKLFAPTLPQNGRGIELQRNISAILCPFGNLITLSD